MSAGTTIGERIYGLLLRAYPRHFGTRYNDDMMVFYRNHRQDPRFQGWRGSLRFWTHTVADLLRTAVTERRSGRAPGGGGYRADLRYALRGLVRDPVFTVVAVVTLALGLGATTAVFSVVHGVLLTPLDYPDAGSLVRVYERELDNPGAVMVAYGNFADLRAQDGLFEELALWTWGSRILTGVEPAISIRARATTANLATLFRVRPALGRWFSEQEAIDDAHVLVLSDSLWRNSFAARPGIVGETVLLDGNPYAVIGVMDATFDFPYADAWVPLPPLTNPQGLRRWHRHNMVGRLATGVSVDDANTLMRPLAARMEADHPDTNNGNWFEAVSLLDDTVGSVRPALVVLAAGVAALLLITCVNLTSLTLARATARTSELALRRALGGSVTRLARLLVLESFVVAFVGGALGLLAANAGVAAARNAPSIIPRAEGLAIDLPVFGFAAAVTFVTAVVVGLVPVWRLRRQADADVGVLLGSTRTSSGAGAVRARRLLVVSQLALALVLTVAAGLLMRTFDALQSVDIGADTSSLLALNVRMPAGPDLGGPPGAAFMTGILEGIEALPGVERAAAVLTPPATPGGWGNNLTIRDRVVPEAELPPVLYNVVSEGYFETLGVELVAGRMFSAADGPEAGRVAIINRAAAELHWPDGDALGKEIFGSQDGEFPFSRIVGIVEDIRQDRRTPARPEAFVPMAQDFIFSYVVLARVEREPLASALAAADLIRSSHPDIPVTQIGTFEDRLGALIAQPRFNAALMAGFAAIALLISSVGVYGVLAYSVLMRQREFGIRVAVGATSTNVLRAVVREAFALAGVALVVGLGVAAALARSLSTVLFGVQPFDVPTFALAATCLLMVALIAAALPARAALRVDPAHLLRD